MKDLRLGLELVYLLTSPLINGLLLPNPYIKKSSASKQKRKPT